MSATRKPDTNNTPSVAEETLRMSNDSESSPESSPASPPEDSSRGSSFTSASFTPPFTLEPLAVTLHLPNESLHRVASDTFYLDSDSEEPEESEETKKQTWLHTRYLSVNASLYKKGMINIEEPLAQMAVPHPEETADTTTFQFGSSEFHCDERSIIEAKFPDEASAKAFREADELIKKLQKLSGNYQSTKSTMTAPATRPVAVQEALTPFLGGEMEKTLPSPKRAQKNPDQNKKSDQTTYAMLKTMHKEEHKNEKQTQASKSLIDIIQEYSYELENNNSTVIYRQSNKLSYDPLVFLPFKIRKNDVNNNADFVGLKIAPWATGGAANDLSSSDLSHFKTFITAFFMFGTSIVGRDDTGGRFPIINPDIELFENQNITSIQVAEVSVYEEAQFEIFKIAIAPLMQQIGNKNKYHFQLKEKKIEDNEITANHLYIYQENNEIFYASMSEKGPVREKIKKSDFKHSDHFDTLLTALKNPNIDQETVHDPIKEELLEIAFKRDHIPKNFKVICHLPYIDYILFGVRLYVEGIMTKNALGAFCIAVLRKKEELNRRLLKTFPKELGIELIIANPVDNLFDTNTLMAIFKAKNPARHADMSTFILEQLQLATDENAFKNLSDEEASQKQAEIVQRCLHLLMTNQYNETQAIVWRDFAKAAEKMNDSPTTLEELLKIGNAVMIGIGCYGMEANQACSLQPGSKRPTQTNYDALSQKLNEHDFTLVSLPEGKELPLETLTNAEKNATPILIKKGDDYSIYGIIDGEWQETKLTSLSKEELRVLNQLFEGSVPTNKEALKGPLLEIVKKNHAPRLQYPFVFCITNDDFIKAHQYNDLEGTKKRAGMLFYFSDYQDGAARLLKTNPSFLLNGLRNGACTERDSSHTPLKQSDIQLGRRL